MSAARYLTVVAATAALCFALVWGWVATAPLAYLDPEYPAWLAKIELLQSCDLGEVVVVGDSRAAVGILPALLPVKTTNLAVGGGHSVEAYEAVRRALACPAPPRRVIVSLVPEHFMAPDLFWERSVRFGFMDGPALADLRGTEARLGDPSLDQPKRDDGLTPAVRATLFRWRFPTLYVDSLLKSGGFLRLAQNRRTLAAVLAARGQYFFGTANGSSAVAAEGRLARFDPLPVMDAYFDRMLSLLAAHGIPVEFVAMPVNEATWAHVSPTLRDGFAAYLAGYAARYPDFHVAQPLMPHWPDTAFGDGFSHLNPTGAARFSAAFGGWLQRRLADLGSADQASPSTSSAWSLNASPATR
jgi:hypothetical protein